MQDSYGILHDNSQKRVVAREYPCRLRTAHTRMQMRLCRICIPIIDGLSCGKGDWNMQRKIHIFDSTLRDGAQAEGISFSVEDKLKILKALDLLGIDYIEAGNPGSNPKDLEFFERAKKVTLQHSRLAAFGSTRRRDMAVA